MNKLLLPALCIAFCNPLLTYGNANASNLLYSENFDDRIINSPSVGNIDPCVVNVGPVEEGIYSISETGRGNSGYCFSSGTTRDPYLMWSYGREWPADEMYVSFWMRYPTFTSTDAHENIKFFYPHWNGIAGYVVYCLSSNNGCYYNSRGSDTNLPSVNWLTCVNQADGNWHRYEFYVKFSLGISRFWYDGNSVVNDDYADNVWGEVINMYYLTFGAQDSEEVGIFTRQIDDIEVWDGMPAETTDRIPPNNPKNLTAY